MNVQKKSESNKIIINLSEKIIKNTNIEINKWTK